ncbi:hypothetical protein DFQ28_001542 [Apophysomyces sp. BC1034]|nr:hypothetical protein DFQ30_007329 [Apophysomyces sp. BC1015]KAG0180236.1 hypothetical protein DFQ29_001013 [Apophysomyces sp. BC1021]KAG0190783.1 hypothetical protein DFQ28_001542 [Apophysomyces sp. BC1034]
MNAWCLMEPYTREISFALLLPVVRSAFVVTYALLLLSDGYFFPIYLTLGYLFGAVYFNNNDPHLLHDAVPRLPQKIAIMETDYTPAAEYKALNLFYPPLTAIVNEILDCIYFDFVQSWWDPLNTNHDDEFEQIVRSRFNASVSRVEKTLLKQERNDLVMATRECRALETAGVPLDTYIIENPQSPFAQLLSKAEQHQQLRSLTSTILRRLLPKEDADSPTVMCLLREMLATHLFGNILDVCSDPDFINCWIVDYLSEDVEGLGAATAKNGKELDVFRSVVEKATEDVIAEENRSNNQLVTNNSDTTSSFSGSQQIVADIRQGYSPETPRPVSRIRNGSLSEKPNTPTMSKSLGEIPETPAALSSESLPMPTQQTASPTGNGSPLAVTKKSLSASTLEESATQRPMIYAAGTIGFNVMDISGGNNVPSKDSLTFIIQIERHNGQEPLGSEGGGYVITRTYADFEVFHAIMSARHAKRISRLGLRLPLDPVRSWLKLGNNASTQQQHNDVNAICRNLEKYLILVVQDIQLGTDQIILAFLRKERRCDADSNLSFAEEYEDEISAYAAISDRNTTSTGQSSVVRAMSMLSRAPSVAAKGVMNIAEGFDSMMGDSDGSSSPVEPARRWFGRRSGREGSISSVRTNNSSSKEDNTEDEHENGLVGGSMEQVSASPVDESCDPTSAISPPPVVVESRQVHQNASSQGNRNKPLSAIDIELLIETTFALIVEIFDLTTANNKAWMRRSLLNVLREIVRRSYTELVEEEYNDYMNTYLSPDGLVHLANHLKEQHWPNGKFNGDAEKPVRTMEEKENSKRQARAMLMNKAIPGGFRQLIGDQNCSVSMDRLWARLQDQALNRILMLQILERVMRPIFG